MGGNGAAVMGESSRFVPQRTEKAEGREQMGIGGQPGRAVRARASAAVHGHYGSNGQKGWPAGDGINGIPLGQATVGHGPQHPGEPAPRPGGRMLTKTPPGVIRVAGRLPQLRSPRVLGDLPGGGSAPGEEDGGEESVRRLARHRRGERRARMRGGVGRDAVRGRRGPRRQRSPLRLTGGGFVVAAARPPGRILTRPQRLSWPAFQPQFPRALLHRARHRSAWRPGEACGRAGMAVRC